MAIFITHSLDTLLLCGSASTCMMPLSCLLALRVLLHKSFQETKWRLHFPEALLEDRAFWGHTAIFTKIHLINYRVWLQLDRSSAMMLVSQQTQNICSYLRVKFHVSEKYFTSLFLHPLLLVENLAILWEEHFLRAFLIKQVNCILPPCFWLLFSFPDTLSKILYCSVPAALDYAMHHFSVCVKAEALKIRK